MVSCQEEDLAHSDKGTEQSHRQNWPCWCWERLTKNWHCAKWLRAQLFPQYRRIQSQGGHMQLQETQNAGEPGSGGEWPRRREAGSQGDTWFPVDVYKLLSCRPECSGYLQDRCPAPIVLSSSLVAVPWEMREITCKNLGYQKLGALFPVIG